MQIAGFRPREAKNQSEEEGDSGARSQLRWGLGLLWPGAWGWPRYSSAGGGRVWHWGGGSRRHPQKGIFHTSGWQLQV